MKTVNWPIGFPPDKYALIRALKTAIQNKTGFDNVAGLDRLTVESLVVFSMAFDYQPPETFIDALRQRVAELQARNVIRKRLDNRGHQVIEGGR